MSEAIDPASREKHDIPLVPARLKPQLAPISWLSF